MKRFTKLFCTLLLSLTTVTMISCGNTDKTTKENSAKENDTKKELSGTVNYAIPTNWVDGKKGLVDKFMEKYPDVTVNIVNYDSDPDSFLTAQAATGDLPDVMEGWTSIVYPLSQGWVQPLNEFIEEDSELNNVSDVLINQFNIDGKIYALPYRIPITGIVVNLDLLEQLNLDVPEYTWTIDEFKEYCKKATNDKYSAITHLNNYENNMIPKFDANLTQDAYNPMEKRFNFTSGAVEKAVNFVKELQSVPGLVADSLKNQQLRDQGKEDDYQKKFGKEVDAFVDGKVLFGSYGTWHLDNLKLNFNYDFYPLPTDPEVGYRQSTGYDFIYMLSNTKDKEATFEFLKWITYSEEGTLSMLNIRDTQENPIPKIFVPTTNSPKVEDKLKSLDTLPNGVKFMYENFDKSYISGSKNVPGYSQIKSEVIDPRMKEARKGEVDISSILKEIEEKANTLLSESWDNLRKDMSEFEHYK